MSSHLKVQNSERKKTVAFFVLQPLFFVFLVFQVSPWLNLLHGIYIYLNWLIYLSFQLNSRNSWSRNILVLYKAYHSLYNTLAKPSLKNSTSFFLLNLADFMSLNDLSSIQHAPSQLAEELFCAHLLKTCTIRLIKSP